MQKQTFDIGDQVKYSHPLTGVFDGAKATITGKILKVEDTILVKFILGTVGQPREVEMWCDRERLESKVAIPDPNWLMNKLGNATKILAKDWDSFIVDNSTDKYYESFDELFEDYEDEDEEEIPNWAWGTKAHPLKIRDAIDLIESKIDDLGASEVYEPTDFVGVDELQQAIDTFNNLNQKNIVCTPDYTKAILFSND